MPTNKRFLKNVLKGTLDNKRDKKANKRNFKRDSSNFLLDVKHNKETDHKQINDNLSEQSSSSNKDLSASISRRNLKTESSYRLKRRHNESDSITRNNKLEYNKESKRRK